MHPPVFFPLKKIRKGLRGFPLRYWNSIKKHTAGILSVITSFASLTAFKILDIFGLKVTGIWDFWEGFKSYNYCRRNHILVCFHEISIALRFFKGWIVYLVSSISQLQLLRLDQHVILYLNMGTLQCSCIHAPLTY